MLGERLAAPVLIGDGVPGLRFDGEDLLADRTVQVGPVGEVAVEHGAAQARPVRDQLHVDVGGELACAHHLWHFTDLPPGHPACGNWVRSSFTWKKQPDGRWLIIHDH